MKKSKNQKKLLWKNRKIPCFWIIVNDFKDRMTVMNWGPEHLRFWINKKTPSGVRDRKGAFKREHIYFTRKGGESQ